MPTSNWKGTLAELKALGRAVEKGYSPSIPSIDCRYDLILDDGIKLWRVQVKYANGKASHATGCVVARLHYETRKRRTIIPYSKEEVDALIVYLPVIDKLCWFDASMFVGKMSLTIRIDEPLNSQKTGLVYAKDYYW